MVETRGDENQANQAKPPKKSEINYLHILDIVIFLVLILSLSFAIVAFGFEMEPENGTDDHEGATQEYLNDYTNEINKALLMATVPIASYVNSDGNETVYIGYSVNQLILEDIYIRQNSTLNFNRTGLENGFESEILNLARKLIEPKYSFQINITSYSFKPVLIVLDNEVPQEPKVTGTSKITILNLDQSETLEIKLQVVYQQLKNR